MYGDVRKVEYTDYQGKWTFYVTTDWNKLIQTSDGSYRNAEVTVGGFVPKSNVSNVVIPKTISGKALSGGRSFSSAKVVEISNKAFEKSSIQSISIPYTIKNIEEYAFRNCYNLKTVSFENNSQLTTINHDSFYGCYNLSSINLPNNLKGISSNLFYNCYALTSISIPASVTEISSNAFYGCYRLKTVNYASNCKLNTIAGNAFTGCSAYTNVTIPSSVNSLSKFGNAQYITNINFDEKKIGFLAESLNSNRAGSPYSKLKTFNSNSIVVNNAINSKYEKIFASFNYGDNSLIDSVMVPKIQAIAKAQTNRLTNDFDKAKAIEEWIRGKVYYTEGSTSTSDNHGDYSVFLNNYTVCDGYARANALLLQAAGVEAYYEKGYDHAFNIIKIGKYYYHSDVCWDDGGNSYDWFLTTDSQFRTSPNHIYSSTKYEITYPSLLFKRYGDTSSINCNVLLGDVNKDKVVNNTDLDLARRISLGDISLNDTKYNTYAADLNFDGRVSSIDTAIMQQYLNAKKRDSGLTVVKYLVS